MIRYELFMHGQFRNNTLYVPQDGKGSRNTLVALITCFLVVAVIWINPIFNFFTLSDDLLTIISGACAAAAGFLLVPGLRGNSVRPIFKMMRDDVFKEYKFRVPEQGKGQSSGR